MSGGLGYKAEKLQSGLSSIATVASKGVDGYSRITGFSHVSLPPCGKSRTAREENGNVAASAQATKATKMPLMPRDVIFHETTA